MTRHAGVLALVIALGAYGLLAFHQLELPGLHYDEALQVLPAMQLVLGQDPEAFRGAALQAGGRSFPLMVYDYVGTVDTYSAVPFMALLGPGLAAVRTMSIGFGALTLVLAYLVARRLFDRRVAALTAVLLAVDPSFVFWNRQGVFLTAVIAALATASLLALLRWRDSRKRGWLVLGTFLLGIGLYAKLLFLWFVVGLAVAALAAYPRALRERLRHDPRSWFGDAGVALASLLAGASGLIAFNLLTGGTVQLVAKYLETSYLGVENLAFGQNLLDRLGDFQILLRGSQFWYLGATLENPLSTLLFLAVPLAAALVLRRERRWRREIGFVAVLIAVMVPLSTFTPTALKIEHYVIFLPWIQLFMAACLVTLAEGAGQRVVARERPPLIRLVVGAAVVAMVALSVRADLGYHEALRRTGGFDGHTSAIYDLARYLDQEGGPVAALDWGIGKQVRFLTQGRIVPDEIFGFESVSEPDPGFDDRVQRYLADPEVVYVFHAPRWTIFPRLQAFESLVADAGGHTERVAGIRDRSGEEIFLLLRVTAAGSSQAPGQQLVGMGRKTH
ncbi:MAG: glycosyltransferase family 39 protein [Anaerolineae bacterium]